jgi:hypothetical protein
LGTNKSTKFKTYMSQNAVGALVNTTTGFKSGFNQNYYLQQAPATANNDLDKRSATVMSQTID